MWQNFNYFQNIFTLTNLINETNQNYIFSLFSHSCTLRLTKIPMFHYHEHITKFRAKSMTFYSCAQSCKSYDLNSIFSNKFVQKKYFFSYKCEILCKTGFILIQNFEQKSHFVQKHENFSQETLILSHIIWINICK